jgi:hypothetical protein
MALVRHADANSYALLNTRRLPVYSKCMLCQQIQTLKFLVVVQGQCTMGCAADESGMEGGFLNAFKLEPLDWGVNPNRKS